MNNNTDNIMLENRYIVWQAETFTRTPTERERESYYYCFTFKHLGSNYSHVIDRDGCTVRLINT